LSANLVNKPDNAYICARENECKIVRWRFGGFAFYDQANIKIYSAMDGVKKVPLPPQKFVNPAAKPGILIKIAGLKLA
jgi:hypothetical protein